MNKRIKQLAEQAGIQFGRNATLDGNDIARFVTTSDMEKFAELIVRECITVARGADGLDATHEAWYLIKEHFGVDN
jgi:hypothetical protein